MRVRHVWDRLVEPGPGIEDPEERQAASLLLSLVLPLIVIGVALSLVSPVLSTGDPDPFHQGSSFVGLAASALLVGVYFIGRTRYHSIASVLVVAIATAGVYGSFIAARHEPNSGFILSFLGLGLLLAGLLLSVEGVLVLCVLDIMGVVALPFLLPDLPHAFALIPSLFVGALAFLVAISALVRSGDARQRRQAEASLRQQEERFRNLVESSPDGIVIVSNDRIVYGNASAARLLGVAHANELIGLSPLEDLVAPEHAQAVKERMAAIEQRGARTKPLEIRVRRRDGAELDVEVMGAPAIYDGKAADQTIIRDITARKDAEEARTRIERLEAINALKTQLLNMASHELNTPIAALRLQLHMLKMGAAEQDPRRAKAVLLLDRNVDRLALLVKDVLDVARLQSGQLKIRKETGDLRPIIEECAELYAQPYLEKGVTLEVDAQSALVEADSARITQVMQNLLSNALKFTDPGGKVRIILRNEDEHATVRVVDSGRGLAPEQIARLFQPFSQVHDIAAETKGGTGLGLHISRGIIEQHGGKIWCESDGPGTGTTFGFTIPPSAPLLATLR